jgi:hypothetical protein
MAVEGELSTERVGVTRPASIFSGRPLARGERLQIAVLFGLAAGFAAWAAFQILPDMMARDFTYPWRGARALLEGQNPYEVIRPTGPAPFDHWFMYPLTAAIAVLPLGLAPAQAGGVIFVILGTTALTYVVTARGMGACWIFASVPLALSVVLAQWPPLLIAATVTPALAWALTCKPTIGLALFLYRPTWTSAAVCAGFVTLAFLVQPGWLSDWLQATRTLSEHHAPVTTPVGALPLLALLRWRRPEARVVAAMALVPQNFYFYDQLPLWLAARTGRSALALTILSWIAWIGMTMRCGDVPSCAWGAEPFILSLLYLPATALVLVDRESIAHARAWLTRLRRGRAGA